jgi:hypothetical protein
MAEKFASNYNFREEFLDLSTMSLMPSFEEVKACTSLFFFDLILGICTSKIWRLVLFVILLDFKISQYLWTPF